MSIKNLRSSVLIIFMLQLCGFFIRQTDGTYFKVGNHRSASHENECYTIVDQQAGCLYSPEYPNEYPRHSTCTYEIRRQASDVCQIQLTFDFFSVAKTRNCLDDYLELQDGNISFKLCGNLVSGSTKMLSFLPHSEVLILKFRSRFNSYKGFHISVKQIRQSCHDAIPVNNVTSLPITSCSYEIHNRYGRITSPGYPGRYELGQTCSYIVHRSEVRACRIEMDFRVFDVELSPNCYKNFFLLPDGRKLCGTTAPIKRAVILPPNAESVTFIFSSGTNGSGGRGFDIEISQLPGPCNDQYEEPIMKQCDTEISENHGTFTSPGYPYPFGPSFECIYSVRRPDPSVCQLELQFEVFDVGRHNPSTCSPGAYFEMPGRTRLCHPYKGRKVLEVSQFQDPVVFRFVSDSHSSGTGFKIGVTQIPNTCKGSEKDHPTLPEAVTRCYQEVATDVGHFSTPIHDTCEFVVKRAHPSICTVQLQISLRGYHVVPCATNYIALPDGDKICIEISAPKELQFLKDADTLTLTYHGHDGAEFNLLVNQMKRSCPKSSSIASLLSPRNRWSVHMFPYKFTGSQIFK